MYCSPNKLKKNIQLITSSRSGGILIMTVTFTTVFISLAVGMLSLIMMRRRVSLQEAAAQRAFQVAEAGVNYYRWHLAHDETDYEDGNGPTGCNPCGPYSHDFSDPYGGVIGAFELEITPPPTGSSIVTIKSTGWLNSSPNQKKILVVRYGIPSLATYSFLTNSDVWFGDNESVVGPLHSNGGIRMDGTNDSIVTSAKETYICTPGHGCNYEEKPGIWGSGPNSNLWQFPVSNVDFNSISADIAQIKTDAQSDGIYYDSSGQGYHLIFKADGTIDIYEVTNLYNGVWQLNDNWSGWQKIREQIKNETFIVNESAPSNGLIFIEDNVWVEGTVNGRFTLVSAKFPENPSTYTNLLINGNLTYLARNGSNALGLIAQKHIKVPRFAPNDITIDAIMLAQKGRVFHNYHWGSYRAVKDSIEVYGGIITDNVWTWTWVNSWGTTVDGYGQTTSIYDSNMTYAPPPSYPTTGVYDFISWEELLPGEMFN